MMVALIDADSILYKTCFAVEDKVWWNELECTIDKTLEKDITYSTDLETLFKTADSILDNILDYTECEEYLLCISDGTKNFRFDNPLGYKQNRTVLRKPEGFDELVAYFKDTLNATVIGDNLIEVDDYVVYLKTHYPDDYILCAIDKDVIYQTVGTHYNYNKNEAVEVTEREAITFKYYQALAGDTSDGYKGCKGIGDKKATQLLEEVVTKVKTKVEDLDEYLFQALLPAFIKAGHDKEYFINTLRLSDMHQYNGVSVDLYTPKL